jgi:hypothetical protein
MGAQGLEGFDLRRTLLEEGLSAGAFGLRLAGLRVEEAPALRDAAVG